ncbi:energy transducer TonB [Marinifilum caeruleilacunae]|uniref:Energy transducer TonB n=1 Tax=Marinifilum caeruleilacunae TaxID=2499076 RepID=A0ABX1WWB4_9BACT|nr:energy transducer TonB [Marinifilum caeruleilacunae]NOU60291.1 energy transducer TonB [Marinifilum caeruleilacunae]
MLTRFPKLIFICALCITFSFKLMASNDKSEKTAEISGVVVDQHGNALEGIVICELNEVRTERFSGKAKSTTINSTTKELAKTNKQGEFKCTFNTKYKITFFNDNLDRIAFTWDQFRAEGEIRDGAHFRKVVLRVISNPSGKFLSTKENKNTSINEESYNGEKVYFVCEKMPEFPGGMIKMMRYLNRKTEMYSGRFKAGSTSQVDFVISKTGEIVNVKLRKSSGDIRADRQALKIVSKFPDWIPGESKGNKVNVRYTVPVRFR